MPQMNPMNWLLILSLLLLVFWMNMTYVYFMKIFTYKKKNSSSSMANYSYNNKFIIKW